LSPAASFWSLIGGLTQPIFEGGTLLHQQRAAQAAYEQATAQYQSTLITAFQNVADVLNALVEDADGLQAADAAAKAAKVTLDVAQDQVRVGYASTLALLNAEQTYQQALITLAQAQSNRFADTAALFQALGGGWWHGA
jgi:outer membrane protein TolC